MEKIMNAMRSHSFSCSANKFINPSLLAMMIVTFLASQRISLVNVHEFMCIIPIFMVIFLKNSRVEKNTLLIMALFLSIDNGGNVYNETPSFVRYGIYFYAIMDMAANARFDIKRILLLTSFVLLSMIITIINTELIYLLQFKTDILTLFFLSIVLCTKISTAYKYELNFNILTFLISVFLLGELLNIYINAASPSEYLNYNTLKSFIIFPSLHFLARKRFFIGIVLTLVTTFVLLHYVSRMILLTYLLILVGYLFFSLGQKKHYIKDTILILGGFIILLLIKVDLNSIENYKFVYFVISLFNEPFSIDLVRLIDPVRFAELELFLDRNFFEIIAGSGIGVGIKDVNGLLDFVKVQGLPTAFSDHEINSGIYTNFHDLWVDFGLRFGLGPLLFGVWLIAKRIYVHQEQVGLISQLLLVLVFCAFFSSAGLIFITLISLSLRRELSIASIKNAKN